MLQPWEIDLLKLSFGVLMAFVCNAGRQESIVPRG
jgi:hypothetical protein